MNRRGFLRMLGMAPAAAVAAAVPAALAAGSQLITVKASGEFVPAVVRPGQFVWHKRITIPAFNWKRLSGWPVYDPSE